MSDLRSTVTIENRMDATIASILAGTIRGRNLAAERLLALSAAEVPFHEGTLQTSGQAVHAETISDDAQVVYDTPYAAHLHEHPEFNFHGGRKGKYLEDPAMQHRDELGQKIATEAGRGATA